MNASDVADLVTFINTFDARIEPTRDKVEAWALALNADMSYEFAHNLIVGHYASQTDAIMPADFNSAYKKHLDSFYESEKTKAIEYDRNKSFHTKATPERVAYWKDYAIKAMAETIKRAREAGQTSFPLAGALGNVLVESPDTPNKSSEAVSSPAEPEKVEL